jgi:excisionase family DNA binding protein
MQSSDELLGAAETSDIGPGEQMLLNARQVAKLLGIGRTKAYCLIAAGMLPVVRIGTAVRVPSLALRDWIARNTSGGTN